MDFVEVELRIIFLRGTFFVSCHLDLLYLLE